MASKEGDKKVPLNQKEAEVRKSLVADDSGNYSVTYDLVLVIRKLADKIKDEKHDFEGHLDLTLTYHPKPDLKDGLFLNFVGEIHSLEINSKKVENFSYEKYRLNLDLSLLKEGENNIKILYSGDYNHNGVGLHHCIDPSDKKEYLYTQMEPYDCHRLLPCFDQPDIKAVLKLKVLAPKEWRVLANAYEKAITDFKSNEDLKDFNLNEESIKHLIDVHDIKSKEYKLYVFEDTPRISTYLYALCAGPYHCIENTLPSPIKLRIFMKESLKDYGYPEEIFKITIAGMKWYSNYFGHPFPFNKYDQIFCPEYNYGAMENVGLVTINEGYCFKTKPTQRAFTQRAITILHELSHMWFGDMVTMKWWDNLWLNESFATFISHLCADRSEELHDTYSTTWLIFNTNKGRALTADQLQTTHPVKGPIKDTLEAETQFDTIVYKKGSSMVKQMYYYIGDENFSKGLASYFNEYHWKNTEFEDFINKMVEAAGDQFKNLKDLCHSWIQMAGLNEISLDMEKDKDTNKITKFVVKQKPCLEKFPNMITHIVDFLFVYDFDDDTKNKVFKRQIIEPKNETVFDFSNELAPKIVFLNYNDYGYMKLDLSYMNLEELKRYLLKCKDPLIKAALNRALFDTFRDSKISSIEYLDVAIDIVKNEQDEDTVSILLGYISSTIKAYLPLDIMPQYKKKFFDTLKKMLENQLSLIEFNKDIVKNILIYLNGFAVKDEDKKYLIKLLNLESKLLTQSRRFQYVRTVYTSRDIPLEEKEILLEREIKRDNNSKDSIEAKIICNSSLPDRKNKEALWKKITEESNSDALANMEAIMIGFAPVEQYDIVEDFLKEKFFEVLPKVGKNNEVFFVKYFISYLSPSQFTNDEIIQKMEKLITELKQDQDQSQTVRYLSETYDLMKRIKIARENCQKYLEKHKK
jgi:aminopeptidase N